MATQQTQGLKRNTIDKYYTKQSVVTFCINIISSNININNNDLIIEPSAGNGSFITKIKSLSNNYKFYDLLPEHDEIIKQDFLTLDHTQLNNNNIHIIGNPPFGRQSTLAIKFIKKCCMFANTISFILPKSFKKESMKKHFSINYHLVYECDIENNAFLVNDKDCDVPCVFQVWQKQNNPILIINKVSPINFKFVTKNDGPHISFRRVGVYAGKISKEIENKSEQSHYFIVFSNNKTIDENINILSQINFVYNNTVGPKSISKQEVIIEFNKYLS